MAITFVGAGTVTYGNYNVTASPPLPAGTATGDLLLCCSYLRSNGTLTSTWATHVSNDGSSTYLLISYKIAVGGDAAPTITPVTGLSGQHHTSCVLAFRGIDTTTPFGTPGTAAQYASAANIGPVAAATAVVADGAVVVVGCRNDANVEDPTISTLTGDGLTWVEACEGSSVDNASHLVVDYAIWAGAAPTLTAKTFTVSASTASVSAGVMLLLRPLTDPVVSYIGIGTRRTGGHVDTMIPTIPAGVATGDLLFAVGYLENAGSLSLSGGGGGWVEHSLVDTVQNGSSFYLRTWYRFVDGTQSDPSITVGGGETSPQTVDQSFILAFRGIDTTTPFATDGANSFNAAQINIGPIAAPAGAPISGAAIIVAHRNGPVFIEASALTGDGLTWTEVFDYYDFTFNGASFSSVVHVATWNISTPTLTAKTIVPNVATTGAGFGKMFVLSGVEFAGVTERTSSISADGIAAAVTTATFPADASVIVTGGVWVGNTVAGDHDDALVPSLPPALVNGDLLLAVGYLRNAGTLSISAGWTQRGLVDTVQNGSSFYLQSWYCIYNGTQTAPTITVTGGSTSPQSLTMAVVMAARGVNAAVPFATDGADSFNAIAANVGPIAVPTGLPSSGAALVIGIRNATPWTSVATLSGDGVTWNELLEAGHTVAGLGFAAAADYTTWSGTAPTLTAKTFVPTGGASGPGMGKMLVLNYAVVTQGTIVSSADVSVVAVTTPTITTSLNAVVKVATSILASMDVSVILQTGTTQTASFSADASVMPATRTIAFSANASVAPGSVFRTTTFFADAVVNPPLFQPDAALSAVAELSAESTDTAWLVLLTLDHPDLDGEVIRVTNDGVPTISNGLVYSPFPFATILPDDVEGRPPQGQIQIDNVTQEIIAVLRGLTSPATLTIQIVRSINPDIVEYEWTGLDWSSSGYDKGVITGTLSMLDLSQEEFPYVTFDGRWLGLFS